jgi:hypothetical protein
LSTKWPTRLILNDMALLLSVMMAEAVGCLGFIPVLTCERKISPSGRNDIQESLVAMCHFEGAERLRNLSLPDHKRS